MDAVETAAYANTPAWHRKGNVIDTNGKLGMDAQTALSESGLDWLVRKVPDFAPAEYEMEQVDGKTIYVPKAESKLVRVENRFLVQRMSDNKYLGSVGATWQPVQNIEGFKLIDDLIELAGGTPWIEAAMALDGGRKVVVVVHLPNDLQIAGEQYASYLAFVNGHDGRTSVTAICHDERIVCSNTLDIGLGEAKGTGRIIRVRHTTKATERIKEAAEILKIRNKRKEQLAIQGEFMAEQSMNEGDFEKFLSSLMPCEHDEGTPSHTMITERQSKVRTLWAGAENLAPIRNTRWGALQAVIEYTDHGREFRDDETAVKNQFGLVGSGTVLKDRAWSILKTKKLEVIA